MKVLSEYKKDIIEALNHIALISEAHNKAGMFDINKDAEEFYRGLLNLFYGWDLKNANTEKDPNYEGVDLLCMNSKIAVQVTSEKNSEKIHKSIKGFKNRALKEGYTELYILMFKGKQEFPRADFTSSVGDCFVFDKDKHIIDHSDLCAKLKDAEFDDVKAIWRYLRKWNFFSYDSFDSFSENDLGIIAEIFNYIEAHRPKKLSSREAILSTAHINLIPKIKINFPIEQKNEIDRLIMRLWDKKETVEKFLQKEIEEDEVSVNELTLTIQEHYCEIKNNKDNEAKIEDIKIIRSLIDYCVETYLPENKRNHIGYKANMEAIIIYFFEFCFIGKKTENEPPPKSLFD